MHHWARRAVSAAKVLKTDPVGDGARHAALADATTGPTETARSHHAEAAALVDGLSDYELARRPDAASWLAAAELYLDLYAEADAHASRAHGLARATGRGDPATACTRSCPGSGTCAAGSARPRNSSRERYRGRAPACVPACAGREPLQSLRRRACHRRSRRRARHRRGGGRAHTRPRRRLRHRVGCGEARCCPARNRATGQGRRAAFRPRRWRGPDPHPRRLEGIQPRAAHTVLAGRGSPQRGRAQPALPRSRQRTCGFLAAAWANRAAAAWHCTQSDTARAIELALASADAAQEVGAPIERALSRTLAGRALAQADQNDRAVAELPARSSSIRRVRRVALPRKRLSEELGKLGHRPTGAREQAGPTGRASTR